MRNARRRLRVSTIQILAYVPQFAAEALGFYEDEDLEVTFVIGTPDFGLVSAVMEDRADLVLGNILFALRFSGPRGLVAIAQSNQTLRHVLSVRHGEGSEAFTWDDLRGSVVFVPSQLPTPWVAFREVLRLQGLSLDELRPIVGYSPSDALNEFVDGVGDYMMTDGEVAQDDRLDEVAALADILGRIPWSVYCAPRSRLEAQRTELRAFRRAIDRAQAWVAEHASREIADLLTSRFPETDPSLVVRIVDRYKRLELWPASSQIQVTEVDRWQNMMVEWGILPEPVSVANLIEDLQQIDGA
jgi:NitT/TauT family transport system substrate-binding protein